MLKDTSSAIPVETHLAAVEGDLHAHWQRVVGRRSFLRGVGLAGAAVLPGSARFASDAFGQSDITKGDVAILRFLAAAELLESDLWSQYNELGESTNATRRTSPRWRTSTWTCPSTSLITPTMISHAMFLNAYLRSKGAQPVNLDAFRTLPSSHATGAKQIGRLTNLQRLDVDTSWYTRYRSTLNPDLGASFPRQSRSATSRRSRSAMGTRHQTPFMRGRKLETKSASEGPRRDRGRAERPQIVPDDPRSEMSSA